MDEKARRYLLTKLYRHIRQGRKPKSRRIRRHWAPHFPKGDLTDFIDKMEEDNTKHENDIRLIAEMASNEKLAFFNVLGSHDGTLKGDFVLASVPNLVCVWEENDNNENAHADVTIDNIFEMRIYVRPADNKVLIYYPNDDTDTGMSWEGTEPGKNYRMERHEEPERSIAEAGWFNGSNGKLYDDDGGPIFCYVDPRIVEARRCRRPFSRESFSLPQQRQRENNASLQHSNKRIRMETV